MEDVLNLCAVLSAERLERTLNLAKSPERLLRQLTSERQRIYYLSALLAGELWNATEKTEYTGLWDAQSGHCIKQGQCLDWDIPVACAVPH